MKLAQTTRLISYTREKIMKELPLTTLAMLPYLALVWTCWVVGVATGAAAVASLIA